MGHKKNADNLNPAEQQQSTAADNEVKAETVQVQAAESQNGAEAPQGSEIPYGYGFAPEGFNPFATAEQEAQAANHYGYAPHGYMPPPPPPYGYMPPPPYGYVPQPPYGYMPPPPPPPYGYGYAPQQPSHFGGFAPHGGQPFMGGYEQPHGDHHAHGDPLAQIFGRFGDMVKENPSLSSIGKIAEASGSDFIKGLLIGAGIAMLFTDNSIKDSLTSILSNTMKGFTGESEELDEE